MICLFWKFVLDDDLEEGHGEAEELDEGDDWSTESEPEPAADGGWKINVRMI